MIEVNAIVVPPWLNSLFHVVKQAMTPLGIIHEIGFRWEEPDTPTNQSRIWHIGAYPIPASARDGQNLLLVQAGFSLNLQVLQAVFTEVSTLVWENALHYNSGLDGPQVRIEGVYQDRPVHLQIMALPLSDEKPSTDINAATGEWRHRR